MKIYEKGPAPSARRVSLFLAEKNIEIPRVNVDIGGGENLSDEFAALSLNKKIPVLVLDDGTSLCESMAICRYIDAAFPTDNHLFGDTPLAMGHVEMWNRIVELDGLFPAFQAFRNITGIYNDRERCVPSWGEESKQRVIEFLPRLEARLEHSAYIAGDTFTVADITTFVMCGFIKNLDIHIDDNLPALQKWQQRVAERPAFANA
ncbi:glutathione S-transferase family protein [Enterovibrio baiacu]|uniref:glutathione S-transferase family protein n=1 Tax=Enterovibrio baiacu TaxID=2491023 RepID=UPI0010103FD7|nr:glutathione S-transferase [Enterovibrio baiacu]MBE1273473.1 glutathione S-transferase [Enterovibrio baiacu]